MVQGKGWGLCVLLAERRHKVMRLYKKPSLVVFVCLPTPVVNFQLLACVGQAL